MSNRPILDQVAHVGAAVLALTPLALWDGALPGAWAGFCMGMVRELTQVGKLVEVSSFRQVFSSNGHRLDLAFWTLGGAAVGLFT